MEKFLVAAGIILVLSAAYMISFRINNKDKKKQQVGCHGKSCEGCHGCSVPPSEHK